MTVQIDECGDQGLDGARITDLAQGYGGIGPDCGLVQSECRQESLYRRWSLRDGLLTAAGGDVL